MQSQEPLFQMVCVRKHFIKSKRYYLGVFEHQMLMSEVGVFNLSEAQKHVPFTFEQRIMWQNSDHEELNSFGILYKRKVKWFEGENESLNQLKNHLSPRVFFGNISLFYDSIKVLGQGATSQVCQVKRKSDLLTYAAKCISKKYLTQKKSNDRYNRLQQEIQILQVVEHPQIVKLLEIYQGENSFYLVTDLLNGDTMYNFIKCHPGDCIPNHEIRIAMEKILKGLEYLDSMGIIHRDIKPENILLAQPNDISSLKILDFGLAIYQNQNHKLSVCGTPGYIAPEVLKCDDAQGFFTTKVDVFGAGVIFYKLLTKRTLFRAQNTSEIIDANRKCQINYQDIEFKVQKEALCLLKGLINPDPKQRLSAAEALQHPYFTCKLEEFSLFGFHERATGFSMQSLRNGFTRQRDSWSIGSEGHPATVKRSNPTQYRVRQEMRQRTRSPRKYADANLQTWSQQYFPSFDNKSYESDQSNSFSKGGSRLEMVLHDEIIEENSPQQ